MPTPVNFGRPEMKENHRTNEKFSMGIVENEGDKNRIEVNRTSRKGKGRVTSIYGKSSSAKGQARNTTEKRDPSGPSPISERLNCSVAKMVRKRRLLGRFDSRSEGDSKLPDPDVDDSSFKSFRHSGKGRSSRGESVPGAVREKRDNNLRRQRREIRTSRRTAR